MSSTRTGIRSRLFTSVSGTVTVPRTCEKYARCFVVEIHLRPHIVLIRAFLVQDLPEQVTELVRGVQKNFVAMLLGESEPEVWPPLKGNLQYAVGHFLCDALPGALVDIELDQRRQRLVRPRSQRLSTPMLKRSSEQLNRIADALPKSLQPFYADALRAFAKTTVTADRFSISPEKASLTILRAVTAPRPQAHYLIGAAADVAAFLKRNLPDRWMDAITFRMMGLPRQVKSQRSE